MVTEEELGFDLESLKQLQDKRQNNIDRLSDFIKSEQLVYENRKKIIETLEDEPDPSELVGQDLHTLYDEQIKRLENIQTIRNEIREEEKCMWHEREIIAALESKQNGAS